MCAALADTSGSCTAAEENETHRPSVDKKTAENGCTPPILSEPRAGIQTKRIINRFRVVTSTECFSP